MFAGITNEYEKGVPNSSVHNFDGGHWTLHFFKGYSECKAFAFTEFASCEILISAI